MRGVGQSQLRSTVLTVEGVILAGGLARRMQGRDKGLITLFEKPMVQWVLDNVAAQVDRLVINANRNIDRYREFGVDVIQDLHTGHIGPLAGLSAALEHTECDSVFMCPCDSPFLPTDMVARLRNALIAEQATIAVARDAERLQPVFLLVSKSCQNSLSQFLATGERKIDRWFAHEKLAEVDFSDNPDAFKNINTEEERLAVEQAWQRYSPYSPNGA